MSIGLENIYNFILSFSKQLNVYIFNEPHLILLVSILSTKKIALNYLKTFKMKITFNI